MISLVSMAQFPIRFHALVRFWTKSPFRLRSFLLLVLAATSITVTGCISDDPAMRVSLVLHELAPAVRLGQPLTDARRVYPTLVVQSGSELHDYFPRSDTTRVFPVAVTIRSASADTSPAADSLIESFEFVTAPSSAAHLEHRVADIFQARPRVACGSLAANGRDSVLMFDTHGRGGVAITFPELRPSYGSTRSHVFIYSGPWLPEQLIPNYVPTRCRTAAKL